ncbi:MAG TPA: class I SAM-dependent methyltransferase [Acidimicrobiia bacterium]|nr:class I SAM-dependent methyltransferase [Acidimicrobiia bacterium]
MNDPDALWSGFLAYLERAPSAGIPAELFAGFRDELIREGMPADQATEAVRGIVTMAADRRDWTAPMFDRIYVSPEPGFSTQPNAFLVEVVEDRIGGAALDIAMGQGRNALYLASCGWEVTGFDVSREGVAVAQREAARRDLTFDGRVAAHDEFEYGTSAWDLIVMTYALVPVTDANFAAILVDALRPEGLIVIESFVTDPTRPPRPVEIDPDRLRDAYSKLRLLRFEDEMATSDWTAEPSRIVRMAAIHN